jgi:hypothetical protein
MSQGVKSEERVLEKWLDYDWIIQDAVNSNMHAIYGLPGV